MVYYDLKTITTKLLNYMKNVNPENVFLVNIRIYIKTHIIR